MTSATATRTTVQVPVETIRIPLRARGGRVKAYALIDMADAAFVTHAPPHASAAAVGGG